MKITTAGIDLAKNLKQVYGVDERGKAVLKKQLKRSQVLSFFVNLPPCLIGMEACGGARSWHGRQIPRLSCCDPSGSSRKSCKAGVQVTGGVATRYPSDCESSRRLCRPCLPARH